MSNPRCLGASRPTATGYLSAARPSACPGHCPPRSLCPALPRLDPVEEGLKCRTPSLSIQQQHERLHIVNASGTSGLRSGMEAVRAEWIPVMNAAAVLIRAYGFKRLRIRK